jgi:hypothetical protein
MPILRIHVHEKPEVSEMLLTFRARLSVESQLVDTLTLLRRMILSGANSRQEHASAS